MQKVHPSSPEIPLETPITAVSIFFNEYIGRAKKGPAVFIECPCLKPQKVLQTIWRSFVGGKSKEFKGKSKASGRGPGVETVYL